MRAILPLGCAAVDLKPDVSGNGRRDEVMGQMLVNLLRA